MLFTSHITYITYMKDKKKISEYISTYTYKSLYSTRDYEHHYFVLRINSKYNFIVTTNTELSEERINDLLDVKITQYKYQIG